MGTEPDEQITERLLVTLQTIYWKLLPDVERGRRGPGVEVALWNGARTAGTPTLRAAYFAAWQQVVESADGVERLRRLWAGEETPPVVLAEPDRTRLAATLALRAAPGWREVLEREEAQIQNPDRKARFVFVRPALSADPADRERFFLSLADPRNREREPWVLDALAYLNHPVRAEHARQFIRPSLDLLEEVQRTGDIFFPGAWIDATLSGHTRPEAAEVVAVFLAEHPDYPPRLRGKILQASDLLERAARIVHGWEG
jgi:aminopeptidase N